MKKRSWIVAAVVAMLVPVSSAAADEPREIISVVGKCPVSEGGYQYSADFFEYRILVWLADCTWYHGETVVVRGSVVRTDPLIGPVRHEMTVYCEPGAPPGEGPHHSGASNGLPGLPGPGPNSSDAATHHQDVRRPPDDCALSLVVPQPTVEHARYEGELHYPSGQGEQHESLTLDCTNVHQFGGCDPPGSPPGISPA